MWPILLVWVSAACVCVCLCVCVQKEGRKSAHLSAQVLIWHDNHIGRISYSRGSSPDIGEDDFCNQHVSGVQIKHLAQPAGKKKNQ